MKNLKVRRTPLYEIHLDLGAEFGTFHSWELPRRYVNPVEEYKLAEISNVIIDRTYFGKLKIWGKYAIDFLSRISTNDLRGLSAGMGAGTVLVDERGGMIDLMVFYVLKAWDDYQEILALISYEAIEEVKGWFNKLMIEDDVKFEDVTDEFVLLSIYGSETSSIIESNFKFDHKRFLNISSMPVYNFTRGFMFDEEFIIARDDEFLVQGFNLIFKNSIAVDIYKFLLGKGLNPIGQEIFDVLRVEAGVPIYGKEITRDYNPLEAGLGKFVSFSKGCYIGWEVLSRIDSYEKLQRRLVGFIVEKGRGRVTEGARVYSGDEEIGKLTSVVYSYGFRKVIALGYVNLKYAIQGERVEVQSDDYKLYATIIIPPFSL